MNPKDAIQLPETGAREEVKTDKASSVDLFVAQMVKRGKANKLLTGAEIEERTRQFLAGESDNRDLVEVMVVRGPQTPA